MWRFTAGAFVFVLQLLPGFSLYRGLYEFSQYAFIGNYQGTKGMKWSDLKDSDNGLRAVFGILVVEWVIFLLLAIYLDQVVASGSGVKKHPLFFLGYGRAKPGGSVTQRTSSKRSSAKRSSSQLDVEMERQDVAEEVSGLNTMFRFFHLQLDSSAYVLTVSERTCGEDKGVVSGLVLNCV